MLSVLDGSQKLASDPSGFPKLLNLVHESPRRRGLENITQELTHHSQSQPTCCGLAARPAGAIAGSRLQERILVAALGAAAVVPDHVARHRPVGCILQAKNPPRSAWGIFALVCANRP